MSADELTVLRNKLRRYERWMHVFNNFASLVEGRELYRVAQAARQMPEPFWTPLVNNVDAMSGIAFEHLVAALLERDRWLEPSVVGGAGDNVADVTAQHPGGGGKLVVQAKRYAESNAVSAPDVQRFLGTYKNVHRADYAMYVTTSRLTKQAAELCEGASITVVERERFHAWLKGDWSSSVVAPRRVLKPQHQRTARPAEPVERKFLSAGRGTR